MSRREERDLPSPNTCFTESPSRTYMHHVCSLLLFRNFFSPPAPWSFFFKGWKRERGWQFGYGLQANVPRSSPFRSIQCLVVGYLSLHVSLCLFAGNKNKRQTTLACCVAHTLRPIAQLLLLYLDWTECVALRRFSGSLFLIGGMTGITCRPPFFREWEFYVHNNT